MGVHLYMHSLIGIKIDPTEFNVTKTGGNYWCEHQDLKTSKVKFCPDCGAKRPKKETYKYETIDWAKLPKPFVKAIEETGDLENDEIEGFSLCEIAHEFNVDFGNGVHIIDGEDDGKTFYLGKGIGSLGGYEAETEYMSLETLQRRIAEVKEVVASLGFDAEKTMLVQYSYWC